MRVIFTDACVERFLALSVRVVRCVVCHLRLIPLLEYLRGLNIVSGASSANSIDPAEDSVRKLYAERANRDPAEQLA